MDIELASTVKVVVVVAVAVATDVGESVASSVAKEAAAAAATIITAGVADTRNDAGTARRRKAGWQRAGAIA